MKKTKKKKIEKLVADYTRYPNRKEPTEYQRGQLAIIDKINEIIETLNN